MKKNWYSMVSQIQATRNDPTPVEYILGGTFFCGEWFVVTPDVLIPRFETEMLIKEARNHPPLAEVIRILDLGTGCGNIAIVLAKRRGCKVYAVDVSNSALAVARQNARSHGVLDKVEFYKSDWYSNLDIEPVDMIVSNPPYISEEEWDLLPEEVKNYEPGIALLGGKGGLEHYKRIISGAREMLVSGGRIVLEIGYNQAKAVRGLLRDFEETEIINDCSGNPRVISAVWIN